MLWYDDVLFPGNQSNADVKQVSNQEAIDIARPLCIDIDKPQPMSACRKLVDLSISRGSADDITVMLVQLGRRSC